MFAVLEKADFEFSSLGIKSTSFRLLTFHLPGFSRVRNTPSALSSSFGLMTLLHAKPREGLEAGPPPSWGQESGPPAGAAVQLRLSSGRAAARRPRLVSRLDPQPWK